MKHYGDVSKISGAVIRDREIVRFTFTVGHDVLNGCVGDWLVSVGNASLAIWPDDMLRVSKVGRGW